MTSTEAPCFVGVARDVWQVYPGQVSKLTRIADELEEPPVGHVRVKVRSIGLNFADIFSILGLYAAAPKYAFVPGLEFCGVIEAVHTGEPPDPTATEAKGKRAPKRPRVGSKKVSSVGGTTTPTPTSSGGFHVGDKVIGLTRFGAYASHVNADVRFLRTLPDGWTFDQGAAFIVQALTAYYALLELANLKAGKKVLIQSAAGGVGLFCCWICQQLRCPFVAVVGNESKIQLLRDKFKLPDELIIVRDEKTFDAHLDTAMRHLQGDLGGPQGFDIVLDSVCGDYFKPAYERLLPAGRYVIFGAASMMPSGDTPNLLTLGWKYWNRPMIDPMSLTQENKSVMGFNLIWLWDQVDLMSRLYNEMMSAFSSWSGAPPQPFIGHTFSFDDAPEAVKLFQSGNTVGKVVLQVP